MIRAVVLIAAVAFVVFLSLGRDASAAIGQSSNCQGLATSTATAINCTIAIGPGATKLRVYGRLMTTCGNVSEVVAASQLMYARPEGVLPAPDITAGRLVPILSTVATSLTSGTCFWMNTYEPNGLVGWTYRFIRPGTQARDLSIAWSDDSQDTTLLGWDDLPLAVTGPATDAELRASALAVSGPLTDAQLRAAGVPVSGPLTDAQLRATAVPVSGGGGGGGGTVTLGAADHDLLALGARGAWFIGGVLLALIVAPMFARAFRFWEE